MNQQSDEGLLNESFLLSRQRGLLSQLNLESERRRRTHQFFQQQHQQQQGINPNVPAAASLPSPAAVGAAAYDAISRAGPSLFGYDTQSFLNSPPMIDNSTRPMPFLHQGRGAGSNPNSLMNQPPLMQEGSRSAGGHDAIFSQRLSLGLGSGGNTNFGNNDFWVMERDLHHRPPSSFTNNPLMPHGSQHDVGMMKDPLLLGDFPSKATMKRRRSSAAGLSFLSEDSCRSGFSDVSPLGGIQLADDEEDNGEAGRKFMVDMDIGTLPFEEQKLPAKKSPGSNKKLQKKAASSQPVRRSRPNNPRKAHLKKSLEGLASAMEKSAKSQQDIHNWDKKMGLKKSHSKTMRLSSRSRKKLLSSCRKEIKALGRSSSSSSGASKKKQQQQQQQQKKSEG